MTEQHDKPDTRMASVINPFTTPLPATLSAGAILPSRAYADDAGLDLYTSTDTVIPAGKFVDVPTGVAIELPAGFWADVRGRSSTLRKRQLLVHPGVIDCGWRGELFAGVWNLGSETQVVLAGERLAQLIIFENTTARFTPMVVRTLAPHARGVNGFGSSGA